MQSPKKLLPLLKGSRFALPLATLAALAMFLISESSYRQASTTLTTLTANSGARTDLFEVRRALTDAETGQRGYLLTGEARYLAPYNAGSVVVHRSIDSLRNYFEHDRIDDESDRLVLQLAAASELKLSELAETIRLHDAGRGNDWKALVGTDVGQGAMDDVRRLSDRLLTIENAKVDQGRVSLRETMLLNRIGVGTMTALCLLALYMYLRQTTELVRQREERRRQVQIERDHLEHDVLQRTAHLTELTRHLQSVREDERHLLARELHDELGALLTAAKLDVARLKSKLGSIAPDVGDRLQHLSDGLNSGIALKRRIIEDLRPSSLSNLGLIAALEILVREWGQRNEIKVDAELEPVRLTPSGDLTVYRLVQEAFTNISKYARAENVVLRLSAEDGEAHVLVRDDGIGFDMSIPRNSAHGLLGMRYRLETERGRLRMQSAPGKGTTVEAYLPEHLEPATASPESETALSAP